MAKLHEIKTLVSDATGLPTLDADKAIEVLVTGDTPEMIPVVRSRLVAAAIPFKQSKNRKFKGALFTIHLRNAGTPFHADWEFA